MKTLAAAVLTAALLTSPVAFSKSFTTSNLTDAEAGALIQSSAWVAEGRFGDRGGRATFELDLGPDTARPARQAQFDWPNGSGVPFELRYDSTTSLVHFAVGHQELSYAAPGEFTDLFIRARSATGSASILMDNLALDGTPLAAYAFADGNSADVLRVSAAGLAGGFTLTGQSTMTWQGNAPRNSRLAYQISAADIPEPATALSLLAVAVLLRRR